MKDILVSYKNGDIYIGIRNAYGNGVQAILFKDLEQQLWNNTETKRQEINTFKANPEYLRREE